MGLKTGIDLALRLIGLTWGAFQSTEMGNMLQQVLGQLAETQVSLRNDESEGCSQ